ncbi:hypothetical protein PR048_021060 [Dryococelus australis]|uniref:Uncharacterized protein n=1 Tax=Dryococelus australis TaxID=614101 RepID=A0ABQ9GX55_9NEOP|nr:hypothetical protein PR048_021060 [Dryococelus australis]
MISAVNLSYLFNTEKNKLAYGLNKLQQLGIRVKNNSLKNLFRYLKDNYITYLLTDELNQDILEIYFLA